MRRHTLRRIGLTLLTVAVATMGLTAPAHAEPDTGTISGRLTDNGAPVPNASVGASGPGWGGAVTDADGYYRITDLPPGDDYRVGFSVGVRETQFAHQTLSYEAATLFTVTAGGETVVNETLLPVGTITGRISYPDGTPLAYGHLTFQRTDGFGQWQSAQADEDGRYSIELLVAAYRIWFSPAFGGVRTQYVPGTLNPDRAAAYQVVARETVTVDDTVLALGTITGRITRPYYFDTAGYDTIVVEGVDGEGTFTVHPDARDGYSVPVAAGSYRVRIDHNDQFMQYVPRSRTQAGAQVFTVAANEVVTVGDEELLGIGSLAGRFAEPDGTGLTGVLVTVTDEYGTSATTTTGDGGTWRVDSLVAGEYRVHFTAAEPRVDQWARGKTTADAADPITVLSGRTVEVDDTRLTSGSVRITARDAVTGAPVQHFGVQVGESIGTTEQGAVVLSGLPAGTWPVTAWADGYRYAENAGEVTVSAGQESSIELALQPYAKIKAKVVDAATGAPIAGVCLFTATGDRFRLFQGCAGESDGNGDVLLNAVEPGRYQIFALPDNGSPYGAQWVGQDGGTGDQREAKSWTVTAGQTRDIHRIRMDRAGTVTGVVTGADGAAVGGGLVSVTTPVIDNGSRGDAAIDAQGRYTIGFLGPYEWPLSFQTDSHAWQWSGGQAKRHDAVTVRVRSGRTTTFDQRLKLGTVVRVTAAGSPAGGFSVAYTVGTGDVAGYAPVPQDGGEAVYRVLGSQHVKLQYNAGYGYERGWYGGTDLASATSVRVHANGTPTVLAYQYH
ncbi:carboxypeptidase-like regulatory domain-containing protein [Catellatospora paridis]|uniref:carboxypeptidase-like regulatory domain-containing protein n=1 Tax=Catellatospora paridis TaxID=1617086 RepID=UPI0012D44A68|nr:carboxypeptidase-like regulatory domain-containing protein [Catellatospora paridis]